MTVTVRFFARARDLAGVGRVQLELPAGATVHDVRTLLAERWPSLNPLLIRSAFAVADEFANDGTVLTPGAEVAMMPPVSGGGTSPQYRAN